MRKMMHMWWWKILGAVLVLYTIVAGILAPVGPGIKSIEPGNLDTGLNTIEVQGYNAHFEEPSTQVFLSIDGNYLCSDLLEVKSDNLLLASFKIPALLSGEEYRLLINNDRDGTFGFKTAYRIMGYPLHQDSLELSYCQPDISTDEAAYFNFPYRPVLYETIRNLYFHVPMWFTMTILLLISVIGSITYLRAFDKKYDVLAAMGAEVAVIFGVLGFVTGSLWGNYTWGNLSDWLLGDAKILGALVGILMYLAYMILRSSMDDDEKRAKVAATYNIFAFAMFIVFIYVMPRMTDTLHPGSGGNPGLNIYDVDNSMRFVFYPAVLGWIIIGIWLTTLRVRMQLLKEKIYD